MPHQNTTDEYSWLRDTNWPNVTDPNILNFLHQQNNQTTKYFADKAELLQELTDELKGAMVLKDATVPILRDGYYYWRSIEDNMQYWQYWRCLKTADINRDKQLILDVNILAKHEKFCDIGSVAISQDHRYLAYTIDTKGEERYNCVIIEIDSGNIIDTSIQNIFSNISWNVDNTGLFYLPANPQWRADRLCYYSLINKEHQTLYLEEDDKYRVSISKSESQEYLFMSVSSSNANEIYSIKLSEASLELKLLIKRQENRKCYISHHRDYFYVLANHEQINFQVYRFAIEEKWEQAQLFIANTDAYFLAAYCYAEHLVIEKTINGLTEIAIHDYHGKCLHHLSFPHATYYATVAFTTFDDSGLRFMYSSLNQPTSTYHVEWGNWRQQLLQTKQSEIPFITDDYLVERKLAKAADSTMIPISLVYKKTAANKPKPLYLYGYGAYGHGLTSQFRTRIIPLLNRGFVFAIAHVRGGDDLGYHWYVDGKLLNKKNSFTDFISVAEYLLNEGYTYRGGITIAGGSAGGMLVSAAMNMAPDLFSVVVAEVPFVDVLNTMLDSSLPLTPGEFKEWGNPQEKQYYDYIASYSPYDNITKRSYPSVFATAGLYDPRVTYWEPAKWIAKLQKHNIGTCPILLKTDMSYGHGGATGRFDDLEDEAIKYAFVITEILHVKGNRRSNL